MAALGFSCECGQIKGTVDQAPDQGLHLICYCDSCRAGANRCGAGLKAGEPLALYLSQPKYYDLRQGIDHLAPFVFSPRGVTRWQASCCGVQMFSTQADPRTPIMSVPAARFETGSALGPVVCEAFVPQPNGKAGHKGKRALARLVIRALKDRVMGHWRKTPLYDVSTRKPIASVTLVSREEKAALLS